MLGKMSKIEFYCTLECNYKICVFQNGEENCLLWKKNVTLGVVNSEGKFNGDL